MSRFLKVAACVVALGGASLGARQAVSPRGVGFGFSSSTMPGSAVTLVTWVLHRTELAADPGLLVIWRGSPGWFFATGGSQSSSGGGSREGYAGTLGYGKTVLSFTFKAGPRSLTIQDKPVDIGADTVVLVDDVDGLDGPRVVGTLRVDLSGVTDRFDLAQLGQLVSRSPAAVAFLKCHVVLAGAGPYAATSPVCRAIAGK